MIPLMARHAKIIELTLQGLSQKEVADQLQVSRNNVRKILQQPLVRMELERRRDEILKNTEEKITDAKVLARKAIEEAAEKAAKKQISLMDCEDPSIQLRASQSILDRALGKADQTVPIGNRIMISADQINILQTALEESKV